MICCRMMQEKNQSAQDAHLHVIVGLLQADQITHWYMMFNLSIRQRFFHHTHRPSCLTGLLLELVSTGAELEPSRRFMSLNDNFFFLKKNLNLEMQ